MLYRIVLPKKAQKDLDSIDQRYCDRVKASLIALSHDPFMGKKLEGEYCGCYSYRVWPYRIIYYIEKRKVIVVIVRVGHRQSVY